MLLFVINVNVSFLKKMVSFNYLFTFSTLLATQLAFAANQPFSDCLDYFPNQKPFNIPANNSQALCFNSFAVLYSFNNKTPIYVIEKLNSARIRAANYTRTDEFYEEARLPSQYRATLADYRNSGLDRGHLAPAADMANMEAMAQSFSLANMVPQHPDNNRKVWKDIESATRKYVKRATGDVYVITGPAYLRNASPLYIGNKVRVPEFIWKIVWDQNKDKLWVYWVPNNGIHASMKPISYQEFVQKIGFDFFR